MQLPALTFTRFIAALAVLIFHFDYILKLGGHLGNATIRLNCGVSYFFTLSGFILVIAQVRQGELLERVAPLKFWKNRFARIYPLFLTALGLLFLMYKVSGWGKMVGMPAFLSVTALQAWSPQYVLCLNTPAWSLSVEVFFYLLFPFLYGFLIRLPSKTLLWLSGILWVLGMVILVPFMASSNFVVRWLVTYSPPIHTPTFLIGMMAGVLYVRHRDFLEKHLLAVKALGISAFLFLSYSLLYAPFYMIYHHNSLFAPIFCVLIISLSFPSIIARIFALRPLVFLGEISFGIYILQMPIKSWLSYIGSITPYQWADSLLINLIIVSTIAALLHFLVERPCRRWIQNINF